MEPIYKNTRRIGIEVDGQNIKKIISHYSLNIIHLNTLS